MKTALIIATFVFFSVLLGALNPPVVSNISAAQRNDGSHILDIHYDVYDADLDLLTITLQVSNDRGTNWDFPCTMISGDVGTGINQGVNKHIVWDLGTEHPSLKDTLYFMVIADDGFEPLEPNAIVKLNAGTFTMGRTSGSGNANELPTHSTSVNSLYFSKYEVTQASYMAIMGTNPAAEYGVGDDYPVYNVSWYAALKYCNLRSIAEGFTPVYSIYNATDPADWGEVPTNSNADWNQVICNFSANGYRLPTEAEWEYAARSGSSTPDYIYSGSADVGTVAWYVSNSANTTHTIGTKDANGLGINDLSGNVMEWCWDWYSPTYYTDSPANFPTGPSSGTARVARGGFFYSSASYCRVAFRDYLEPYDNHYGLRVCRSILTAAPEFSPGAGTYTTPQTVTLSCITENAIIRYTTDGSDPDDSSAIYTDPISVTSTTTIKARAFKDSLFASGIVEAEYVIDSTPAGFVFVPAGTFTMGRTTGSGQSQELPTHSVTLNSFYMAKYEVTQGEYQVVMGENPSHTSYGIGSDYPVNIVSWYSSIKYCNLRSISEGLTPVYTISGSTDPTTWGTVPTTNNTTWNAVTCDWSANGYRLPTEAEWEYAARGATNSPDYLYSGSNDIGNVAWYNVNSGNTSHIVGTKSSNGLGLFDMSGNPWEWCWDWYSSSYYSVSPASNPTGPSSGQRRVSRGGGWDRETAGCRVVNRDVNNYPYLTHHVIGFRVCRSGL